MGLFKKIFIYIFALVILIGSGSRVLAVSYNNDAEAEYVLSGYEYPIVPGTAEWKSLSSHKEMLEAVQISEKTLKQMSTEELARAVLKNPMIVDIYAYYTVEDGYAKGYEMLCSQLNCMRELQSRPDGIFCLSEELKDINTALSRADDNSEDLEIIYAAGYKILQCMENKGNEK